MRVNKYVALATGMSRRAADTAISAGQVLVNGQPPQTGQDISDTDTVQWNGTVVTPIQHMTIILNKPVGYVCSRDGQGSQTIYNLLPERYHNLKPVGRLDKDSSGLILLTNDGALAQELTHPRYAKTKVYEITLDKPLEPLHQQMIHEHGIQLDDGPSKLHLEKIGDDSTHWTVRMQEGRNRQIRRTFAALGYTVIALHRSQIGNYVLGDIATGHWAELS